tara:strand:+ start:380 stop:646 length:267 start_codon:yes stop_codon:yes gene_type:complete
MLPVRCFTCGAVIARKLTRVQDLLKSGNAIGAALSTAQVHRYCCRRMFMCQVDNTPMEMVDLATKEGPPIKVEEEAPRKAKRKRQRGD